MTEFNDNQYWHYGPVPLGAVSDGKMVDAGYDAIVLSSIGEGPKGDPGEGVVPFDDLTDEQLQKIYEHASFATNRTIEATITTAGASTSSIEIPIENFDQFDMLFVDVNGLDLCEGEDYTISGSTLVLAEPLPAGQDVHFKALRYALVDGNKTIESIQGVHAYTTVPAMVADSGNIQLGDICHVLGKDAVGDGKGGWFRILGTGAVDNDTVFKVGNMYAKLAYRDDLEAREAEAERWRKARELVERARIWGKSPFYLEPYTRADGTSPVTMSSNSSYWGGSGYTHGTGSLAMQGEFTLNQNTPRLAPYDTEEKLLEKYPNAEPVMHSEYAPASGQSFRNCLEFVLEESGVYQACTAGLVIYPSGNIYIIDNVTTAIPQGTKMRFQIVTNARPLKGDFLPGDITPEMAQKAANWVKQNKEKFVYSNKRIARLKPPESGRTDCSGMVYSAYKYGAGIKLPNGGTAQAGFGKLIAFATPNESLDLSNALPGDVIGFWFAKEDPITKRKIFIDQVHHVAMYVGNGEVYQQNSSYDVSGPTRRDVDDNNVTRDMPLGPRPYKDPTTAGKTGFRALVRYANRFDF